MLMTGQYHSMLLPSTTQELQNTDIQRAKYSSCMTIKLATAHPAAHLLWYTAQGTRHGVQKKVLVTKP
jgi:hypothetical protein